MAGLDEFGALFLGYLPKAALFCMQRRLRRPKRAGRPASPAPHGRKFCRKGSGKLEELTEDTRDKMIEVLYRYVKLIMPEEYERRRLEGALRTPATESAFFTGLCDEIIASFVILHSRQNLSEPPEKTLIENFLNACVKHILYQKHHRSHPGFAGLSPALWSAKYDAFVKSMDET